MGRSAYLGGIGQASGLAEAGAQATALAAPWHTTHIPTRQSWTVFQGSGTLLQAKRIRLTTGQHIARKCRTVRGKVGKTPSRGVNWRYCQHMAALPWDSYAPETLYMGNLTYHKTPTSGLRCKEDLEAWFAALNRLFGGRDNWGCIWVMEFQKRGALHYHFILRTPRVLDSDTWHAIVDAWLRITGESEDVYAALHGCQLSQVRDIRRTKMYECKYMGKHGRDNAKAYEKVCPEWFNDSGRWWGIVGGNLAPSFETFQLRTADEWYTVKRLLRGYVRSITQGKYTPHTYGADNGQTVLGHGGDLSAYRAIVRWLTMQRPIVSGPAFSAGSET